MFKYSSEIECGRYNKIPHELRICKWCKSSMGADNIEDENHLLFECDLYANLRSKLIIKLNTTPHNNQDHPENTPKLHVPNIQVLKSNLMTLLSPHTSESLNNITDIMFTSHHKNLKNTNLKIITPHIESLVNRRSYISNCICTFICRAIEKRKKLINQMREINARKNTIVINFVI